MSCNVQPSKTVDIIVVSYVTIEAEQIYCSAHRILLMYFQFKLQYV
jgi:hypothetical protein